MRRRRLALALLRPAPLGPAQPANGILAKTGYGCRRAAGSAQPADLRLLVPAVQGSGGRGGGGRGQEEEDTQVGAQGQLQQLEGARAAAAATAASAASCC